MRSEAFPVESSLSAVSWDEVAQSHRHLGLEMVYK